MNWTVGPYIDVSVGSLLQTEGMHQLYQAARRYIGLETVNQANPSPSTEDHDEEYRSVVPVIDVDPILGNLLVCPGLAPTPNEVEMMDQGSRIMEQ